MSIKDHISSYLQSNNQTRNMLTLDDIVFRFDSIVQAKALITKAYNEDRLDTCLTDGTDHRAFLISYSMTHPFVFALTRGKIQKGSTRFVHNTVRIRWINGVMNLYRDGEDEEFDKAGARLVRMYSIHSQVRDVIDDDTTTNVSEKNVLIENWSAIKDELTHDAISKYLPPPDQFVPMLHDFIASRESMQIPACWLTPISERVTNEDTFIDNYVIYTAY